MVAGAGSPKRRCARMASRTQPATIHSTAQIAGLAAAVETASRSGFFSSSSCHLESQGCERCMAAGCPALC